MKLVMIGVYGTTESTFFKALKDAGVTHFCDIRQRRGLRGKLYSYANSRKLQSALASLGIKYSHEKALAPTNRVREAQKEADQALGNAKRTRTVLSEAFVSEYRSECLTEFEPTSFISSFPDNACVVLFCVERAPEACHRSLVAEKVAALLQEPVRDITP